MIRRLVVIGVGLIGGSMALALRQAGEVGEVIGLGRSRGNLEDALRRGVIDQSAEDVESAIRGADCVLLAVPVGAMQDWFTRIAPFLPEAALLVDAGSTKQDVVAAARRGLGNRLAQFVPSHPIAGAEHSGVAAARADLFQGKGVILTPLAENAPAQIERARAFWSAAGARVQAMTPTEHDAVFAAVSHLPHLAAFALVDELAGRPLADLYFQHAGSGFRDFTRIAGSSPEMWRDIALANRVALTAELDAYLARLAVYRNALAAGDAETLLAAFRQASAARREWSAPLSPGPTG